MKSLFYINTLFLEHYKHSKSDLFCNIERDTNMRCVSGHKRHNSLQKLNN